MIRFFRPKVDFNNFEEIKKYFPKKYLKSVLNITVTYLKKHNIKGVILDLDNTIMDYSSNILEGFENWKKELEENGIKTIIVTNNVIKKRIEKLTIAHEMEYVEFARKPKPAGLEKALKIMGLEAKEVAVVGDQIQTDILGGNNLGMHTILVEPITEKKDYIITKWKRPFEKKIIEKYFEYLQSKEGE